MKNLSRNILPAIHLGHSLGLCCMLLFGLVGNTSAQQIRKTTVPVSNSTGPLDFPFAGGLDAPQFSAVDLNRDGLQDVFVFDRQGYTAIPFLTTFDEGVFGYAVDWDVLRNFPVLQQWALLLDFNQDGVEDLFASTSEPGVQGVDVYRGRIEDDRLAFRKMTFDIGDYDLLYFKLNSGFTPLYVAWIDYPVIRDIDSDGDVDILTFEPGGSYVHYFKNIAVEQGLGVDTFLLEWEDVCWGKFHENAFSEIIELSDSPDECAMGQIAGLQARHSGSALAAYDFDTDGDQDLLVGDLSSSRITQLINGGTVSEAWMTAQENHFPAGNIPVDLPFFVTPFMVDINHDGIEDFVAGSNNTAFSENYNVAWYYTHDGNANFTLQETNLFVSEMLDFGTESKPAFLDYNADDRIDMIVGTGGYYSATGTRDARLILLENTGTVEAPVFQVIDEDYLSFSQFASIPTWEFAPAAGDMDQDGDIDLLIGDRNGRLFYLENLAGPGQAANFAAPVYPYADINVGTSSTPTLVDLNGDGLLDIVCGERIGNNDTEGRCSNLNYFQNIGTMGDPVFNSDLTQAPNTQCLGRVLFSTMPGLPDYSAPAFFRTPDGVQMVTGSESGRIRLYDGIDNVFTGPFQLVDDQYGDIADGGRTVPSLADIDNDGYYEMVLGNKRGGLTLYDTDFMVSTTSAKDKSTGYHAAGLMPNPARGTVYLQLPEKSNGEVVVVEIHDHAGRLLKTLEHCHHGDAIRLPGYTGMSIVTIKSGSTITVQKLIWVE